MARLISLELLVKDLRKKLLIYVGLNIKNDWTFYNSLIHFCRLSIIIVSTLHFHIDVLVFVLELIEKLFLSYMHYL